MASGWGARAAGRSGGGGGAQAGNGNTPACERNEYNLRPDFSRAPAAARKRTMEGSEDATLSFDGSGEKSALSVLFMLMVVGGGLCCIVQRLATPKLANCHVKAED